MNAYNTTPEAVKARIIHSDQLETPEFERPHPPVDPNSETRAYIDKRARQLSVNDLTRQMRVNDMAARVFIAEVTRTGDDCDSPLNEVAAACFKFAETFEIERAKYNK